MKGTLMNELLMRTYPKVNSLTLLFEERCVHALFRKRVCSGISSGKFKSVLLGGVPYVDNRPPAPKGLNESELLKKNRAETLSLKSRNSRIQVVVNWSSVKRPGLLQVKLAVVPGVPPMEGIRNPPGPPQNCFPVASLAFNSLSTTGSICPPGTPARKVCTSELLERSAGRTGIDVLTTVPRSAPLR